MLSKDDKAKFLAVLPELLEYAKERGSQLKMQEVGEFFQEIDLTKEHFDQIYAYLLANGVKVQDAKTSVKDVKKYGQNMPVGKKTGDGKNGSSIYLKMYLEELSFIPPCNRGEELDLYARLLKGEEDARVRLAEAKLSRVVEIVREYIDDGLITEDLIQEGNMGLMMALSELMDRKSHEDCGKLIDDYIRQSIAFYADGQIFAKDQEKRLLSKLNLIQEASKKLAEEMGRIATVEELAEYTCLPVEEIEDMIKVSEGKIETGNGDG